MEQKPLTLLVIGIVAGALVGFGGGFAVYNSQIVDLKGSLTDVQLQYVTLSGQQVLSTQKDALQNDYSRLNAQNKSLGASYNQLQSTYGQLQSNYGQLQTNYGSLKGFLGVLTNDVMSLNQTFY
jgi:chromosome segregation ATPase